MTSLYENLRYLSTKMNTLSTNSYEADEPIYQLSRRNADRRLSTTPFFNNRRLSTTTLFNNRRQYSYTTTVLIQHSQQRQQLSQRLLKYILVCKSPNALSSVRELLLSLRILRVKPSVSR